MNCDICRATGTRFFRVEHETRGIVHLCGDCFLRERHHLRPVSGICGCG